MTGPLKPLLVATAMVLGCALGGCQRENAAQLLKTAQFEELQNNPEHARQLYEAILRDYANSAEAVTARERLRALQQAE